MSVRCCAFGMQLEASFPLTGVRASCDPDLPVLNAVLAERGEVEQLWSGGSSAPEWVGRLGDGRELRLERGIAGDRLFSYGEQARFHLSADATTLFCAPLGDGLDWQRALLSKVIPTVGLLRGYEALHASALETPAGALALLAPSGTGKTTLALELLSLGGTLISDDILVLSEGPHGVLAHPATPHMNLDVRGARRAARDGLAEPLATLGGEVWSGVPQIAHKALPVSAVFLLVRRPSQPPSLRSLAANPMQLAPYMLGVEADAGRRRERFGLYASLASQADLFELSFGLEDSPGAVAGTILSAAGRPSRSPVGAA